MLYYARVSTPASHCHLPNKQFEDVLTTAVYHRSYARDKWQSLSAFSSATQRNPPAIGMSVLPWFDSHLKVAFPESNLLPLSAVACIPAGKVNPALVSGLARRLMPATYGHS